MLNAAAVVKNTLKLSFKVISLIVIINDFENILKMKINN